MKKNYKKGQTLLELIFVISIVSTSIVMFSSLLDSAIKLNSFNKEKSLAQSLAMEGVETVKAHQSINGLKDCSPPCSLKEDLTFSKDMNEKIEALELNKSFIRKVKKTNPNSTLGQSGVGEVEVSVTWESSFSGKDSSVSIKVQP